MDAFSKPILMDVLSAEFALEDQNQNKSFCLTVLRNHRTGELFGLVEGVEDCFYARKAKKNPTLKIDLSAFKKITMPDFEAHLQALDPQLKFYLSEGE